MLKIDFRSSSVIHFGALAVLAMTAWTGCSSPNGYSAFDNRRTFKTQPVATWVHGKYIDENSPLAYVVKFRNVGKQVISFDYTIADQRNVPHVDRNGQNSGLVSNLYPGVEVEVPNPLKRKNVFVTLGSVTYGKKTADDLQGIYASDLVELAGTELDTPSLTSQVASHN
jgi:hypothetical protein